VTAAVAAASPQRFYYGWKVLAALFMAGFMVYGGGLWAFTLFVMPLTEEFHWTRAATGGLVTAFWLSAPMILLGGSGIKRFGAVRMLVCGILIEAACLAMLATVSSFWQMYLLRAPWLRQGRLCGDAAVPGVALVLAPLLPWARYHLVGLAFRRPGAGARYRPGDRALWLARGLSHDRGGTDHGGADSRTLHAAGANPKQLGLALDGDPLDAAARQEAVDVRDNPPGSLGALLGSATFWFIALMTLVFFITYSGLITHQSAIVEGAGFIGQLPSTVLGATAGFAGLGSLCTGWLLDRYSTRNVGIGMCVLLLTGALSLLAIDRLHSTAALFVYATSFGFTVGGGDLYFVGLLRLRFPTISVAFSYSAWYFCQILTLLIGGPIAGRIYDLTGDYATTLGLLVGTAVAALVFSLVIVRPERKAA